MKSLAYRPRAVKMPKPCEFCLGDVYMVDGETSCSACRKKPTPVNAGRCPSCGTVVAENVPHFHPEDSGA